MRKLLSSSNAVMVAIVVVLLAIGAWVVFGSEDEQASPSEAAQTAQETPNNVNEPAIGGGPPGQDDQEPGVEIDEPPVGGDSPPPNLDSPDLEVNEEPESRLDSPPEFDEPETPPSPTESSGGEPGLDQTGADDPPQVSADADQEEAYQSDRAPEAQVLGVEPADSDEQDNADEQPAEGETRREGGGPIDDQQPEAGPESPTDERYENGDQDALRQDEALDEEAGGEMGEDGGAVEGDSTGEELGDEPEQPVEPGAEEMEQDGQNFDRPAPQRAPRPGRPGDEDDG